jgi:hypothetical protein
MKKLKASDINVDTYLLQANMTHGFKSKLEFESEDEAKKFYDKVKSKMELLPDFLKPKL